jgi:hypothetical protein
MPTDGVNNQGDFGILANYCYVRKMEKLNESLEIFNSGFQNNG